MDMGLEKACNTDYYHSYYGGELKFWQNVVLRKHQSN